MTAQSTQKYATLSGQNFHLYPSRYLLAQSKQQEPLEQNAKSVQNIYC